MNFYQWNDPSVRLTGRWTRPLQDAPKDTSRQFQLSKTYTCTTAPGSYLEIAFRGRDLMLNFDLGYLIHPFPHLYIQIDGGPKIEAPVDRYLHVDALTDSRHVAKIIYKGGMEQLNRWYPPLAGCISFMGYEAEAPDVLEPDNRKIIEFIGDSITEGVLIEADRKIFPDPQPNRPYQDDSQLTYATLTAEALNLRPIYQAYGAVGMTRDGCASVPRAGLLYPYCFDRVPYTGEAPDYIMINHGANDRAATEEEYIMRYREFLDIVTTAHPAATVICLGAFVGAFDEPLGAMVKDYQKTHPQVHFISTKGWIEPTPLHPLREGHRTVADHLIPLVKEILGL